MELSAWQAAEAAGGRLIIGEKDRLIHHVSLNSGKMQGEDLFVPIIGERVDAHRFLGSAFENGAACMRMRRRCCGIRPLPAPWKRGLCPVS